MNQPASLQTIEVLAGAIRSLVNGEPLPATNSAAFDQITTHVRTFLANGTQADQAHLGVHCLGILIEVARAKIQADIVLKIYGEGAQ